jgi:hypothetical protein
MRVLAPASEWTAQLLNLPVVVAPVVYDAFCQQQDEGVTRWGAWVQGEAALNALPPPQPKSKGAPAPACHVAPPGCRLRADAASV